MGNERPLQALLGLSAKLAEELDSLRTLPRGWDGYQADPFDPAMIDAAKTVAAHLDGLLIAPKVVPMTRGRLQFEWHRGNRSLELELESPTSIHFLKWDREAGVEEEDTFHPSDANRVRQLVDWFASE